MPPATGVAGPDAATDAREAAISSAQPAAVATDAVVEFHDLTVSYGPILALNGVSGAFRPGATGLLGPNGAGKTTLLKTLLGFLKPDRGRIDAFGLDPAVTPLEVRRRIGYMPEVDCHLPGMTAAAYVAFAGELSGMPRDEAVSRAHEVLYYVGLDEARYRTVDTYSTGMKQRVKLAQALVHDPDLLLLDEPTNGLDPDGREEMLTLIADVARRRQMSLILCSHLLRDVERVCERVIVFNQGEVAARGTIAELTGARRSVYDLRVKGDPAALLTDLRDQGCEWREADDGYRLFLADGLGPDAIFRTARACGVQVRYLRPGMESLEDVFLRALGHEGTS
jgi:ABC-2 type transport system ATP-binding protein